MGGERERVTGLSEAMDGFPLTLTEAVCFGASLAVSGFGYYYYKKNRTTLEALDGAPRLTIDGKLKDILKVTPGACLQYAVIEGAVQPVGEPLSSHLQKEFVGVLQNVSLREHSLLWNNFSRSWTDCERVVLNKVNAVPFVLVGSNETAVRVLCPLEASGQLMETTYEKFHQVEYGLGDIIVQYLRGEKLKGRLETEKMLKVGSILTGVGELTLDPDNNVSLRPPSNGSQYCLSITDFDTLRGLFEDKAFWWKALAVTSALVGAAVLLWAGWRYYNQLRECWEREEERRLFARASRERAAEAGPEEGDRVENACVICYREPRDCILLYCGHVCCCYSCYQSLPHRQCPICRQSISRVLPLFQV